jgi:hypothetical protein
MQKGSIIHPRRNHLIHQSQLSICHHDDFFDKARSDFVLDINDPEKIS